MTLALLFWIFAVPQTQAPESFQKLSERAAAAREGNQIDEAIQLYGRGLKLRPAWTEGWWYLGTLLYDRDAFARGRDAFARFVRLDPKAGPGWAMLGLCEFQTRNYERSLEDLRHGLSLGLGGNPAIERIAQFHTALLLTRFGQFEAALQVFTRSVAGGPQDAAFVAAMGLAALRMPILPADLPAAKREIVYRVGQAVFDTAARHAPEAKKDFEGLIAQYGEQPEIHYLYGAFLLLSDSDAALTEFRRELQISPKHVPARLQLAFEYLKRGEPQSGLPFAREAAELDANSFVAHNALGRALVETGDIEPGIAELQTACKLSPESPENHVALAGAYIKAGRAGEAARERTEFLRLKKLQEKPAEP